MNSPYFNTIMHSVVSLHPSQMNNDIYKHLKNNLIRDWQGKCYKSYGFISKIFKIEHRDGGSMIPEDTTSSASFNITYSCRICRPLKGTTIVCEVIQINKSIILLRNGPINVFILESQGNINKNNFIYDDTKNVLIAKISESKGIAVVKGTYVKVKVINVRMENKSKSIIVLGTLENIATDKEKNDSILATSNDDDEIVNYDEHIKNNTIESSNGDINSESKETHSESDETNSESEDANSESDETESND